MRPSLLYNRLLSFYGFRIHHHFQLGQTYTDNPMTHLQVKIIKQKVDITDIEAICPCCAVVRIFTTLIYIFTNRDIRFPFACFYTVSK